jgi:Fe-S cluster biogenesis protein NfuA
MAGPSRYRFPNEVHVIRSALKAGLKKVVGRVMGVTAPPPPPAAPTWAAAATPTPVPNAHDAGETSVPVTAAAPAAAETPVAETPVAETPVAETPAPMQGAPEGTEAPGPDADAADATTRPKARRGRAKKVTEALVAAVPDAPAEAAAPPPEAVAPAGGGVAEGDAPLRPTDGGMDDTAGPALTMEALQEVIDEMVRPALQGDGGDITLLRIEGRKVYVRLVGACSTCPSSIVTLKMGVEALLKEEFPSIEELVQES